MLKNTISKVFIFICFVTITDTFAQQLPTDFYAEEVSTNWDRPVGLTFDDNGQMYVWEKSGKVFIVDTNGTKQTHPLIDISEEVGDWRDHGLLGFTLDSEFLTNGYFYLLYAVDNYHLFNYDSPNYNPNTSYSFEPSIGRLTRYKADISTGFTTTVPNSRYVLMGESLGTSIVLLHESHGVGALVFGEDGSLLISSGDGAFFTSDIGDTSAASYASQAIAQGIINEDEDIGSYRTHYLGSHNGKILRIDPQTGDGLPSNPFYDVNNPRSAQSRTYSLGLRNPFRFTLRPNTGSHYIGDGNPGALFIGDVGSAAFEELNIATQGGQNFGYPLTEGNERKWDFHIQPAPPNMLAPNPLYGIGGCNQEYFTFKNLFASLTLGSDITSFPNPCDSSQSIPSSAFPMIESRPAISWSNALWNPPIRSFVDINSNNFIEVSDPNSPVQGVSFGGTSAIPGMFYQGNSFPDAYKGALFCADFYGWIRVFRFDDQNILQEVETFYEPGGAIVHVAENPKDGCIYYVDHEIGIYRICYGGTPLPVAIIDADTLYGNNELTVNFDASQSYAPFGYPVTFEWDFGDGSPTTTTTSPTHTFTTTSSDVTPFVVTLTVTDSIGTTSTATKTISLNNSPPNVEIISFKDGDLYPTDETTILELIANVQDKEHDKEELTYEWQTNVHHNTHFHPEPIDDRVNTATVISPVGCDSEIYWYRITLKVTDAGGLSTFIEQNIYPNCDMPFVEFIDLQTTSDIENVYLNFETANEDSVLNYEIQHSTDNFNFAPIASLSPNNSYNYEMIHKNPVNGDNYYRIKASKMSNAYLYSRSKQVIFSDDPAYQKIKTYPNPTVSQLNILFESDFEHVSFQLFNQVGQMVLEKRFSEIKIGQTATISIDGLDDGVYYYKAIGDNDEVSHGKVMIIE